MSVNPLDLQTNFMHIGTVGKKEVLAREQEIMRQEHTAEHLRKEGNKSLEDVPATNKAEALEKTDEKGRNNKDHHTEKEEEKLSDDSEELDTEKQLSDNKENGVGGILDLLG
ncbi:MAG: hypothetical protein A2015_14265 [Spirochaetes bacterium GWF1_31_7]|nr:MAG: hypothetical protein A2Y30_03485 [Spirochaetes bacterium GWE1_32_154]OHD50565.1 MAG: hypothetical protein A2015_14265 [Spirochaetes bacterium GWF1_31_7]OHD79003.1 MAG: hypothetical protein A2355_14305 [Spirochaetes bacterium RIFOXYB1_FULL_32_8]HBD94581.1 hypothetical protein [Spirochaetia bacterium]HBI36556.1 hypothetical protein [Spirochaetia bacterium]